MKTNVSALIAGHAAAAPHATALLCGAARLSYAELDAAANRLAGHLLLRGVGAGDTVPLLLERSFAQIIGALGVMRAGAAFLPMDTAWPDERVRAILEDSGASVYLAADVDAARLASRLTNVCPAREAAAIAASVPAASSALDPDALAYVIYTSGSTGKPKGVEITHGNLMNLLEWHVGEFHVDASSRAGHIAGLGFDAAVWEVWPYLAAGATVQLPGPVDDLIRSSPADLLRWIHDGHLTHCFVPTALAEPLIQAEWPDRTLLRYLLTGGDALRRSPAHGLPFIVVNNYGPTECTVVSTFCLLEPGGPVPPPIGRAIHNARAYVLDENGAQVAEGTVGELYVGGASVGRGYRNLPEQTAAAFLPDPFSSEPKGRMYRTGDLVSTLPDGRLAFHGRRDTQQKIRGQRMELDEISAVLERCEGVAFSLVGTHLDRNGEKQLIAYVLPAEFASPGPRFLQEELGRFLPAAMIPHTFVRLRTLPLNTSGKLDLAQLPAPAEENLLKECEPAIERKATSALETAVLEIVHQLLGTDKVGAEDDFFLSGGHSLLGAQLVTRIRSAYGVELTLRDLFESPTAAQLAMRVETLILLQLEQMSDEEAEAAL